jgi:hypothetical protein
VKAQWDAARVGLGTLEQALIGAADQINNALAMVLLNVQFVDDLIDGLGDHPAGAGLRRHESDGNRIVGDIVAGVLRIRDVVRDLGVVAGMSSAPTEVDVGGVASALVRLIGGEAAREALVDQPSVDTRCHVPRHVVVAALALCMGELYRERADGNPSSVRVGADGDDGHVVVRLSGNASAAAERFALATQLIADAGGELRVRAMASTLHVELRLPRNRKPGHDGHDGHALFREPDGD